MTLPPHALQALVDIKKELLSHNQPDPPEKAVQARPEGHTFHPRHARAPNAYQRACQKHEFFSPVY